MWESNQARLPWSQRSCLTRPSQLVLSVKQSISQQIFPENQPPRSSLVFTKPPSDQCSHQWPPFSPPLPQSARVARRTRDKPRNRTDDTETTTAHSRNINKKPQGEIKRKWRKDSPIWVAAWNTRSWNNKSQEVLLELSRNKIDICAISETKKKGKGNNDILGPCPVT